MRKYEISYSGTGGQCVIHLPTMKVWEWPEEEGVQVIYKYVSRSGLTGEMTILTDLPLAPAAYYLPGDERVDALSEGWNIPAINNQPLEIDPSRPVIYKRGQELTFYALTKEGEIIKSPTTNKFVIARYIILENDSIDWPTAFNSYTVKNIFRISFQRLLDLASEWYPEVDEDIQLFLTRKAGIVVRHFKGKGRIFERSVEASQTLDYKVVFREISIEKVKSRIREWQERGENYVVLYRKDGSVLVVAARVHHDIVAGYEVEIPPDEWIATHDKEGLLREKTKEANGGCIRKANEIRRREIQRKLDAKRIRQLLEEHKGDVLTVEDSIAAGNCEYGTRQWAKRYGFEGDSVTVSSILNHPKVEEILATPAFQRVVVKKWGGRRCNLRLSFKE